MNEQFQNAISCALADLVNAGEHSKNKRASRQSFCELFANAVVNGAKFADDFYLDYYKIWAAAATKRGSILPLPY